MYQHFDHILFRSPLQSLQQAFRFPAQTDVLFQEGLYLSSPEFWNEYQKAGGGRSGPDEKLRQSFAKYWLRSCTRCTPYGTFAGSALAGVSDEQATRLLLGDKAQHTRRLRIDMNYISGIIQALIGMPVIREQVVLHTNNSLYELPDGFRYAEYTIQNNVRNYHLTSIDKTDYIKATLQRAAGGATVQELCLMLMEQEAVDEASALEFIDDMWQSQLLAASLEPCVTGREPLDQLIGQLESFSDIMPILQQLKKIQALISNPAPGVAYYQQVEDELRQLGLSVDVPKNTLQADLFLNTAEQTISKSLITAIINQAEDLKALARPAKNKDLDDFKQKFYARYEEAEVPLAIVLDADLGIGYGSARDELAGGSAWIDDLLAFVPGSQNGAHEDYITRFTLSKYHDWLKHKQEQVVVTEEELEAFRKQTENYTFPSSMHLMGSLLKQDGLLDAEHFVFDLSGFSGPSGGNILGRFTHGDAAICQLTQTILAAEEATDPGVIYAEIAHLPQARVGNILLRPVLRRYEIPYVGKSGTDKEHQIPLEDLYVRIEQDEVILFSHKLGKRIMPRLTTAHNFSVKSLPVYRFLCDLQAQHIAYPNVWDWGPLVQLRHLPRVIYKNLVLHKAKWRVEEKDLGNLPKDKAGRDAALQAFRNEAGIPVRVVYVEGDNELLIDFEQELGRELFLHYLNRHKSILLEEFLFTEENCVVRGPGDAPFTNEIIIPVTLPAQQGGNDTGALLQQSGKAQRHFALHSEWLYFKVYSGSVTAEKVLKECLLPFVEQGLEDGLFERFFFIRYRDESGAHFRIRFYNTDTRKQAAVARQLMAVLQPLLDTGTLYKVTTDRYSRELERYGEDLIEAAEHLFCNDSLAVLRFINLLDGEEIEQYRLYFAMRGIGKLLDDFGYTTESRSKLLKAMQTSFFKEFGGHPALQKQLNGKYRNLQKAIARHLDTDQDDENGIAEAAAIFETRSISNGPVIEKILSVVQDDTARLDDLLRSYIHMFMNRLFLAQQRKYELLVYFFLDKYYLSQLAMAKHKQAQPA